MAGTAQTPATDALSATALSFATTPVGEKSAVQQLVLTNAGDLSLTLVATGGASADFAVTNSCGNSLSGHSACTIAVQFVPQGFWPAVQLRFATLSLAWQAVLLGALIIVCGAIVGQQGVAPFIYFRF